MVAESNGNLMRLHVIDFLRGLALTIVLLDHVDLWARPAGFFRDWTLMGLGFSDAAEAFVFLSGFTFGWVYSPRLARDGFLACQKRAVVRAVQIYGGYLATVLLVTSLAFALRRTSLSIYPAVTIDDATMLRETLYSALRLMYQPFALGILCLYVVVLPFLPALLSLCRRWWWAAAGLSACLYAAVQFDPGINLPAQRGGVWFFNPFAWQFLIVLGMVCGHRFRNGQRAAPRAGVCTLLAVVLVLYGVLVKKGAPLLSDDLGEHRLWMSFDFWRPPLVSKSSLGPLRLLHFLALAHLVTLVLPKGDSAWRHPLARPLVVCGRHSLPVYCAGTVLAYLSVIAFRWIGATPLTVLVIGLDACLLQCAFAALLEQWKTEKGGADEDPACTGDEESRS